MSTHRAKIILSVVATAIVITAAVLASLPRTPNWDIVPYVALALESRPEPPERLREHTYAYLSERLPPDDLQNLLEGQDASYRQAVASNDEAFQLALSHYRGRIAYQALWRFCDAFELNLVKMGSLLSTLAILGLSIAIIAKGVRSGRMAEYFVWIVAVYFGGGYLVSKAVTPDAFAVFSMGMWYLSFAGGSGQTMWLVLLAGFRPDQCLTAWALQAAGYVTGRHRPLWESVTGAVAIGSVGIFDALTGPSFAARYLSALREPLIDPSSADVIVTSADVYLALVQGSSALLHSPYAIFHCILAFTMLVIMFAPSHLRSLVSRTDRLLLLTVIGVEVARFLIFPAPWPRLFVPLWVLTGCITAHILGSWIQTRLDASGQAPSNS